MSTSRILYLDLLRLLATFGVIFLHVFATGFNGPIQHHDWYVALVGNSLVRWSVPIFVMISGAIFLNPDKQVSLRSILTKRIPRLLIAYVFWYSFYVIITTAIGSLAAREFIFQRDFFKPALHLWFLPMLCAVYLLTPILRRIANDEKLLVYALVLWMVYVFFSFLLDREIPQLSGLFEMNIVAGYSGYFLCGYYMSQHSFVKRERLIVYVLGIIGLIVTITGSIVISIRRGAADTKFLVNLTPQVIMMAAALFLLIKQNAAKIGDRMKCCIKFVRGDLFGVYLVHWFWLIIFNRPLFRDFTNHIVSLPLVSILVFICSLFSTKLLRKIPVMKKTVE